MNDPFIYSNAKSLSKILCDEIIELFEKSSDKHEGYVISGLRQNVKNTDELVIPKDDIAWSRIHKLLEKELIRNIKNYISKCNAFLPDYYNIFNSDLFTETIQIQRYRKNIGKYIYHNDGLVRDSKIRRLTFIWYLNDVLDGGETEFLGFKIVPEVGKLFIFPATWTYPHKANIPISNDKYIMTGWLCEHC